MNRRVRGVSAALFALLLVVQAPVASAAMQRDREPSFVQRIVKSIKNVLKPFGVTVTTENDEHKLTPPRP